MAPLNEALKRARRASGMSYRDAAEATESSISSVYEWEAGKTCPSAEKLGKLADAYKITTDELMGRMPPRKAGKR
mgnify:CR=1 FL=1